ncbi:capsular exopolysaccharide synthesis family protein [Peribacillus deserti]|uniref:non-specific protein-tyrosine kinase n=1 Tax=Peribacillus deserti TaxID=673318 RepID=A0ABS2QC90_9BACI|nr:CpsD/CapB family tyrosine-protein kinase [Peribacillus deserti]MBM7690770.1 capsular exopolysaccharide synthesis family protein [Peribacillus deserti]
MALKNKKQLLQTKRKLVTQISPKSPISEQYKTIRTNIQFSAIDEEMQTLLITSPGPGEGKSTTVANLAVVFAQAGKKVLLVDSDLRKPTAHYTFSFTNTFGLTNVLTKQMSFEKAVKVSDVENLDILTSGPIPPNPAELLGSKIMGELMGKLKGMYDIILFDTPPILAVTDAQVLSNMCDGVIMVVSSGRTEKEMAVKAKEHLLGVQAKIAGVVLNNKDIKESSYYYYYGKK